MVTNYVDLSTSAPGALTLIFGPAVGTTDVQLVNATGVNISNLATAGVNAGEGSSPLPDANFVVRLQNGESLYGYGSNKVGVIAMPV